MTKTDFTGRSWIVFLLTVAVLVSGLGLVYAMWREKVRELGPLLERARSRAHEPQHAGAPTSSEGWEAALATALEGYTERLDTQRREMEGLVASLDRRIAGRLDALEATVRDLEPTPSGNEDLQRAQQRFAEDLRAEVRTALTDLGRRLDEVEKRPASPSGSARGMTPAEIREAIDERVRDEVSLRLSRMQARTNERFETLRARIEQETLDPLPVGTILAWDSRILDRRGRVTGHRPLPDGWRECDGRYGTPDLEGRFLFGATSPREVGNRGGKNTMDASFTHWHAQDQRPGDMRNVVRLAYAEDGTAGYYVKPITQRLRGPIVPAHVVVRFIIKTR